MACAAGLGLGLEVQGQWVSGVEAWEARYATWGAAGSPGGQSRGLCGWCCQFVAVYRAGCAGCSGLDGRIGRFVCEDDLDTACRLQRYVIQELASTVSTSSFSMPWSWLTIATVPLFSAS